MIRKWTARKRTTLNEAALDPDQFANAYPLFRAGPSDPRVAIKEAAGLLVSFVCLALPIHAGVCWLASTSVALAAALGGAGVLGLLAVALLRHLGQDDLLRKLPLVLLAALLLYGLMFLTSAHTFRSGWGGLEAVGVFLLATTVASVLASFYQPMAAAYRSVTQATPASQLLAAAAALALSVGTAVVSRLVPEWAFSLVTVLVVSLYAGLILFEYAAWEKADPARDLQQALAALRDARSDADRDRLSMTPRQGRRVLHEAALFGLALGVFVVTTAALRTPESELARFLAALDGSPPEKVLETLAAFWVTSVLATVVCLATASAALDGFRFPKHSTSLLLAWKPFVVFLTYPDTPHPLAHRLRFRWLRPRAVRLALSAGSLLFVGSLAGLPNPKSSAPPAVVPGGPPTPPGQTREPQPEAYRHELEAILGGPQTASEWQLPLPTPELPITAQTRKLDQPSESTVAPFVLTAVLVLLAPPLCVYITVGSLGVLVLPAYHSPARKPAGVSPTA